MLPTIITWGAVQSAGSGRSDPPSDPKGSENSHMVRRQLLGLGLIGLVASRALAAPESGLPVGTSVEAFDVVDVSGPKKGMQLCYV